ncbi:MAG: hypothetical protein ACI8VE_000898 [Natrialbaceae archaeon]|jgi:hypothetical protein
MERRTLLRSLAAAGFGAALTGCLADGNPGSGEDTTVPSDPDTASRTPTDHHTDTRPEDRRTNGDGTTSPSEDERTSTPEQTGSGSWDPDAEKPFEIVKIGSREPVAFPDNNRPHEVAILNELDRERELRISIEGATDTDPEVTHTCTFPDGGWVLFRLNVPSRYEVTLRASGTTLGSVTVDRPWFDCNGSRSRVGITDDAITDYDERTTMMACPDPEVTGTDLTVTDRRCGSSAGQAATVSFDGEQVIVDGTIATATPCRIVEVESADYSEKPDRVTVGIETSPSDEVCQQCLGTVQYAATIDFEHDMPDEVVVEHRSRDRTETVAKATRNENE